jgi:hypothetical protein
VWQAELIQDMAVADISAQLSVIRFVFRVPLAQHPGLDPVE